MDEGSIKSQLEATQQTVKFFESLMRASADGIMITDAMQNIVVTNDAFSGFFGRRSQEVVETNVYTWIEQLDGDARQRWAELEKQVRLEGLCSDVEFLMATKDRVRYLSVNASILERVAEEEIGVIISIWRNVTERKQAETVLKKRTAELQSIINSMAGREVRMAELKKVIKKLRSQLEGAGMTPVADDPLKEVGKDYI